MKPVHRYPGLMDPVEPAANAPGVAPVVPPAREDLRRLAEDIVKYCPGLARMLIAFRECPPGIGLN